MTLAEAERMFREAARRLPDAIIDAEARSLAQLEAAVARRSQGPLQPADLKRMGHPYARRRLRLNPDVVNKWSGEFAGAWKTDPPVFSGGVVMSAVYNASPKASSLEAGLVFGEPLMAPRGPHLAAFEEIEADRERRLADVWDVIFR
jgi:hypothetical protein